MTTTNEKLSVTIYASAHIKFDGTREDLEETYPDIYMPSSLGGDKEDLGADNFSFSVDGDNDKVLVDKGLLLALVAQCQDYSGNESVYDDSNHTSYKWTELNKLVSGHTFPKEVTGANSDKSKLEILDQNRRIMAGNILRGHDFGTFTRINFDNWNIEGEEWTSEVSLMDPEGREATTTMSIKFEPESTNVKKVSHTPVIADQIQPLCESELLVNRRVMADNALGAHSFQGYEVTSSSDWAIDGDQYSSRVFLENEEGVEAVSTLNISFQSGLTDVRTMTHDLLDFENTGDRLNQTPFVSSQVEPVSKPVQPPAFDVLNTPIFNRAKSRAIRAAIEAAIDASDTPKDFVIDRAFTDCGEINTSEVITVIDEFAADFGIPHSHNYYFIVDALCEAVTSHFAEWLPAEA